jgi:hypothetical protein
MNVYRKDASDPTGPAPVVKWFDDYHAGPDGRLHRPCAGGEKV